MKPLFAALLVSLSLVAMPVQACPPPSGGILPGRQIGPVTAETSEAKLIRRLGAQHVKTTQIYLGEGMSEPGTILFPNAPAKTLEIRWKNPKVRRKPDVVFLRNIVSNWSNGSGSFYVNLNRPAADWKTPEGITLGTRLSELERLNGKPFEVSMECLGSDAQCGVVSWHGGKLEHPYKEATPVAFFFGADFARVLTPDQVSALTRNVIDGISGVVMSDHPVLRQVDPAINAVYVSF